MTYGHYVTLAMSLLLLRVFVQLWNKVNSTWVVHPFIQHTRGARRCASTREATEIQVKMPLTLIYCDFIAFLPTYIWWILVYSITLTDAKNVLFSFFLYASELLPSSLPGWPSHSLMKFSPILFWILRSFLHTYCPRKMRQRSGLWSLLTTTWQLSSGEAMEDFCLLLIHRVILRSLRRTQGLYKVS